MCDFLWKFGGIETSLTHTFCIFQRPTWEKRVQMSVDWAYETTWGSGSDPLLIQTDIPTREYIPTICSAHVMIQMLLELHSKINIFTQKKKKKE